MLTRIAGSTRSVSAFSQDEERYLASGANAFLSKPINHDSLRAKIATLLRLPLSYEHFNVESMLGEYWPFADQLRALAKGYQSKAILHFVKRYYLDETETSLDHDTSTLFRK
ncbi:hypothetical protein LJR289_002102 [Pseudoduganella sp. LjRoot289]|uniref:hypothetical protein n=1 Tax=Pseudoduganella sp. LjRoot289 TaxID=3342314 RepID=UPI003ECE47C1